MDPVTLNKMLEGRVKELASMRRGSGKEDLDARKVHVVKTLGLHPLPPRQDLNARVTGTIQRDGYRIEKLRYESRPGLLVTAHLYLPETLPTPNAQRPTPPFPLVVSSHGTWKGKKAAPVSQARGTSFALRGFATLIVDAPGNFGEDLSVDERGGIGAPGDPALIMGAPWIGQYAWDLIRGVDACLGRTDIDPQKIAVTGEGDGGIAALMAFSIEPRFGCAALVCTAPSMEQKSLESIAQLGLPGLALAGDFSDILLLRSPSPVMLLAASEDDRFDPEDLQRTFDKLAKANKNARFEGFESGPDYNRRMREAVGAFLAEHLLKQPKRSYLPELRPLTDGAQNPYPAGTVPQDDPSLFVTDLSGRQTITFQDVLRRNMAEPHPEPYHAQDRLVPWLKFAPLTGLDAAATVALHDLPAVVSPKSTSSIGLPVELVDTRLAVMVGLSLPEFFAQVLHLSLPGRPDTWEREAIAGDGLSAMIASVKTLMKSASPETIPVKIVAEGPVASLTAMFLRLYRPSLEVETSHTWSGWSDLLATPAASLMQPQARYLEWPF
ncbi:MAG: alpha/beta hydrolase family protein [Fimbriimonadales bacterium]